MRVSFFGVFVLMTAAGIAAAQSEPRFLQGHSKAVTTLAWSAEASTVATASDDRSIRVWNSETGRQIASLSGIAREGYGGPVVAFSRDLKVAAINYWGEITLRNMSDGEILLKIDPILGRGQRSAFRPDVFAMAFRPDGMRLATAGSVAEVGGRHGYPGGVVIIWNVQTGALIHKTEVISTAPSSIAWDRNGDSYTAGTNGAGGELPEAAEVLVWDAETGKARHNIKVKQEVEQGSLVSAADVSFSPDGSLIAVPVKSGSRSAPAGLLVKEAGGLVQVWNLQTGSAIELVNDPNAFFSLVDFGSDGQLLATAGSDDMVRIWDINSTQQFLSFPNPATVTALQFSPDGKSLGVGCADGSVYLRAIHMR